MKALLQNAVAAVVLSLSVSPLSSLCQEQSKDLLKPSERSLNVRALVFSPDGQQLAGSSGEPEDNGEVVVWDAKTHNVRWVYKIERGMPAVAFSPDGKTLAVGSFTENCFLIDADTGKVQATLPGHGESARSLAFTPDGQTLAIGSYDQTIRLWDWRAGKVVQTLKGQADKVYSVAYLPDGKTLASGGSRGSACLWDAASGKLLHKWERGAMPLAFDPKGQWLATAGNDSSVTLRSIEDYDKALAHYDRIFAYRLLVIHPSAKSFAANSGMDTVVSIFPIDLQQTTKADEKRARALMALWDEEAFEVREKASQDLAKMGNVTKALLSKAAKDSASAEVRIRARELLRLLGAPKPLAQLRGHHDNVMCASFSPGGQILATGSRDGSVLLWDTATWKLKTKIKWPESGNVDRQGDPLPPGAVARLGTVRFRTGSSFGFAGLGFLPDSKTIVTAAGDRHALQLWNATTGQMLREINTGKLSIFCFALRPDGKQVAVAGRLDDEKDPFTPAALGIWDVASGKQAGDFQRSGADVGYAMMTFTPDGKLLLSLGGNGILRIAEAATGVELLRHKFPAGEGWQCFALSPDGSEVALGAAGSPYLWRWQAAEEPRQLKVSENGGGLLAFSPVGKMVAASDGLPDGGIRILEAATSRLLHKLEVPDVDRHWPNSLVFSADGKTLIASTNPHASMHFWDAATGKHLRRFDQGANHLTVSPDGRLLAGTAGDCVRVWDLSTGKLLDANEEAHEDTISQIAAVGNIVATAGNDNTTRVWDAVTGNQRIKLTHADRFFGGVALSPDGSRLVTSGHDDTVSLWDTATGRLIYKLPGHGRIGFRGRVGFTSDGKYFLSFGTDLYLRKWDAATGKAVLEHAIRPEGLKIPEDENGIDLQRLLNETSLQNGSVSPDGRLLLLSTAFKVYVFDAGTGREVYQVPNEGGYIVSFAASPDSRMLVASATGKTIETKLPDGRTQLSQAKNHLICLWDLATRQMRKQILLPDGGAGPVAFSPDGKLFAAATGEPDRRIRLWDVADGKEVGSIQGFRGRVHALAFAAGGSRLVSGMDDTTALVWDLKDKR